VYLNAGAVADCVADDAAHNSLSVGMKSGRKCHKFGALTPSRSPETASATFAKCSSNIPMRIAAVDLRTTQQAYDSNVIAEKISRTRSDAIKKPHAYIYIYIYIYIYTLAYCFRLIVLCFLCATVFIKFQK